MTRAEAKVVLSGFRPNGADWTRSYFAQALVLAEQDPELQAWLDTQADFDRKVSAKIDDVPVPEELRGAIVAAHKIATFPPQPVYSIWLAAAAMVALLCVAATFTYVQHYGAMEPGDFENKVVAFLGHDSPNLAMTTSDRARIADWLSTQRAPMGSLPPKFDDLPCVGCQKYVVRGHAVSLVCFSMKDGHFAHLFMVDKHAIHDPPTPGSEPWVQGLPGGYVAATWTDDKMAYVLATQGTEQDLRGLL